MFLLSAPSPFVMVTMMMVLRQRAPRSMSRRPAHNRIDVEPVSETATMLLFLADGGSARVCCSRGNATAPRGCGAASDKLEPGARRRARGARLSGTRQNAYAEWAGKRLLTGGRVGARGQARALGAGPGKVWEWTSSDFGRLSGLRGVPLPASTPRCSSARNTRCCAAARGRRTERSRALLSETGTPRPPADLRRLPLRARRMSRRSVPEPRCCVDVELHAGRPPSGRCAVTCATASRRTPKELPPKWLYDERGSRAVEEITRLPEYYLTAASRISSPREQTSSRG